MSIEIVKQCKSDIINKGLKINGPCGAFMISNLVALRTGLGILWKPNPTENNCIHNGEGFAADIVMERNGLIYDVLIDGGGLNTPAWNAKEPVNRDWYRDPFIGYPLVNGVDNPIIIPNIPPVIIPPIMSNHDALIRIITDLHIKIDNFHTDLNDKFIHLETRNQLLQETLLNVLEKQDRAYIGGMGIRLRLVPEVPQ